MHNASVVSIKLVKMALSFKKAYKQTKILIKAEHNT